MRLALFNAALTGTFSVGRRWAEGRLRTWREVAETFVYGVAGGYGFYQAKRLIGNRRDEAGLGLAYLSASVVENTARGGHPLGHVRLGYGPVDLRLRTPLSNQAERRSTETPPITVEVNALSALSLGVLPLFGLSPSFQGSSLYYESDELLGDGGMPRLRRSGLAFNRTIVLGPLAGRPTRSHETIHLVQSMQVGAVTPYYRASALWPGLDRSVGRLFQWDVQIDWLYSVLAPAALLIDYEHRWAEIEASSLQFRRESLIGL